MTSTNDSERPWATPPRPPPATSGGPSRSLVLLLLFVGHCGAQVNYNGPWWIGVITDCSGLGYPNATKNDCGFCTGLNTELTADHGKNCRGTCDPSVFVDCNGDCAGTAYIDECSGECIGGRSGKTEEDVSSFRDCRGYCTSSGQYFTDKCGVCHTGSSPFNDCTNRCYLPGQEEMMAKLVCGRCVGGSTNVPEYQVLDECGNCRTSNIPCPCNGTGEPDVCGECRGRGGTCFSASGFEPRAISVDYPGKLEVKGAFRGRTRNLKCLLKEKLQSGAYGEDVEFQGRGNGTLVTCTGVKLPAGEYRVGVKLDIGDPPETDYYEGRDLLVYGEIGYNDMSPITASFDREESRELVVTFSGGNVPRLPITCIVKGKDWPKGLEQMPSDDALDRCVIPYPNSSMVVNVSPSLDGRFPFGKSFQFTFSASPPKLGNYYVAEDGHAIVVVFDRPIYLCNLTKCSQILNAETLSRLGDGATCQWATKQQLIITVLTRVSGAPVKITFQRDILLQDGQKFPLPQNEGLTIDAWYPTQVSNAQVAISGPNTVPYCGEFTLVGHFSSPKGDARYFWTANRADRRQLESQVDNYLRGIESSSLIVNCSLLEVGMQYLFILTAQHPVNEKYEASHPVTRMSHVGAVVLAYSDVMTQASVTVDQRITLHAEMSLPSCYPERETLRLIWSVDNPKVKFNFNDKDKEVYIIEPYTLPENTEIVFSANAYFLNLVNVTSSRIRIHVESVKLKAAIKGTSKRITGNKTGNLTLESEDVNFGIPLVYQWKCYYQDNQICYNYKQNSTEPLLIPRSVQNQRKLIIPCESLKAGQELTFELKVFNANNSYQYSPIASVVVVVENGGLPQVVIDSVIADGTQVIEKNPVSGVYSIPARLPVTIFASFTPAKKVKVKWDVKGFANIFTYSAVKNKTFLSLEEDFLVGHGVYLIGASACYDNGTCGVANLSIRAIPGVELCQLDPLPFVEYQKVSIPVIGCSIPPGRQPVTYQLYLHTIGSVIPLTSSQTSTVFNIFGPPQQGSPNMQMSVEVCDRYSLCKLFPGPKVRVTESENREADRNTLLQNAIKATETNEPVKALSMFLTATTDTKIPMSDQVKRDMIDAAAKAVNNRYVSAGHLSLIYSAMLPLLRQEDNSIRLKALEVIQTATRRAYAYKTKVPTSVLAQGHSNAAEAMQCGQANRQVSDKVKETLEFIVEKISTTIPLGNRISLESKYPDYPSTLIFRQMLDKGPIYLWAKSSKGNVEGSVRFEQMVRERIRRRKCTEGPKCDGIVVAMTIYPQRSPHPSENKIVSPVMDITLRKPEDGKPFKVANVPNSIRMALSHHGNVTDARERGFLFRCLSWNENDKEWSNTGLITYTVERDNMTCWSSHLTSFALIEVYDGLSTASVVAIVVTAMMGVFIIMMFAFFFFRKKQVATTRVSNEALQPKRHSEKLRSVNGSVAQVKTITP